LNQNRDRATFPQVERDNHDNEEEEEENKNQNVNHSGSFIGQSVS
jgi:hypothetical protein